MYCRAAGYVAKLSGCPVLISNAGLAIQQLDMLRSQAVPAKQIIVGHSDDRRYLDRERDKKLASDGMYVAFDHVGWERDHPTAIPDTERIRSIQALLGAGLGERVLVSCSSRAHGIDYPPSPVELTYLLQSFVPALRQAGVSEDDVALLIERNPARALGLDLEAMMPSRKA
jgi:phosphotriesterase-related protein